MNFTEELVFKSLNVIRSIFKSNLTQTRSRWREALIAEVKGRFELFTAGLQLVSL